MSVLRTLRRGFSVGATVAPGRDDEENGAEQGAQAQGQNEDNHDSPTANFRVSPQPRS